MKHYGQTGQPIGLHLSKLSANAGPNPAPHQPHQQQDNQQHNGQVSILSIIKNSAALSTLFLLDCDLRSLDLLNFEIRLD